MYKQQKALTLSTMALHRQLLRERLQILINTSETFAKQIDQRNRLVQPLLKQLEADLNQIEGGPLEQMRDWMSIRERIMDAALQTAETKCESERITVDLAEELGTLTP